MSSFGQDADLQFQHAEPLPVEDSNAPRCVVCKQTIGPTYFHAQGQVVCPTCAGRIQSGQEKPPAAALGRAALYGIGAALAGCILYAAVAILLSRLLTLARASTLPPLLFRVMPISLP